MMVEEQLPIAVVHLEALPSDRSSRAAGAAPVNIIVEVNGDKKEKTVLGTNDVLRGVDRLIKMLIMVPAFSISASVSCDAKAGVTTCRMLQSIANALCVNPPGGEGGDSDVG